MPSIDSGNHPQVISARVWRDLAQLAIEALAIGVVFSVLLALAVFVVARGGRGEAFAESQAPQVELHASASVR